jgi:hypothetical protein
LEDEDFEVGKVSEHFNGGEFVATEIEFGEFGKLFVVEHIIKIFEFTAFEFEFDNVFSRVASEIFLKNLLSESACEMLSGLNVLRTFD